MSSHRIAVIPGDGIGKETVPEGIRVLNAIARRFSINLQWEWFDFGSCDYYLKHGKMLPDNWFEVLSKFDAIFFGAVGWPATVPDHVSLWGSLLQFPAQIRSIPEPSPRPADARHQVPAGQPDAGRHRLLCGARKY